MKFFIYCVCFILYLFPDSCPAQAIDTLWTRTYGGTGWDNASAVCRTDDGGYVLAGFTESFGNGPRDMWVVKTDSQGDTLWTRTYGGPEQEIAYCIRQTGDGGYIVAGQSNSFGSANYDLYLVKLNAAGDTLWAQRYGDANSETARDIRITSDGGFIISGSHSGDAWLLRTNQLGDTVWTAVLNLGESEVAESVCEAADGGFITAGATGAFGLADLLIIKVNSNGDSLWAKTFGGVPYDWGHAIVATADGGCMVAGTTSSFGAGGGDVWLLKIDSSGDTLWTRTFGGNSDEKGLCMTEASDGGYVIGGTKYVAGAGGDEGLVLKTDATGTLQWEKNWGGFEEEWILGVDQSADGNYIACGFTSSFGEGNRDMWLLKIGPTASRLNHDGIMDIPNVFKLYQNYPNPFNESTNFQIRIPKSSHVTLKIFNVLGEEVNTLLSASLLSGSYTYHWNATNLASGVYLYRLEAEGYVETRKMILMR